MTTQEDFINFIAGLAVEGETALKVFQRPLMRNGEPTFHGDGTPKYTYPAVLPSGNARGGSVYMNTGAFILSRFDEGRISASAANCDYVLCMMLDDIGTKSKEPPLTPTWIMETSEGSFQWGYAFSEQPSKGHFTAAIRAIAAAGYTDPGAINAVRNFRVPGSVNLKPGRNSFEARLVQFNPEREYTLGEICAALDVTPGDPDTDKPDPIRLADTGTDTVLSWLNEQGMVLSATNAEGWLGIVCPNSAQHTDGMIEARYRPLERAFCCYHGHCEDFTSTQFLQWVCDNGGPMTKPGVRDDLLASRMAETVSKLKPTDMFSETASDVVEEVTRRELGRVEKADWYKRFAYVLSDDCFFDTLTRRLISRPAFNATFRHINCKSIHDGKRRVEAAICYDENRQHLGAQVLMGVTYAAGDSVLVAQDGDVFGNRWRDARPAPAARGGDISRWLDHCKLMVPDDDALEHIFDVMAFKLQNPRVKINHAILHGGKEGCGKDTMWAPFLWAVCGPAMRNRGLVDNDSVSSAWGYHLESEVLIINELREPSAMDRRALANKLKPIIAAPPEMLTINRKNMHPYDAANRAFVLSFTNDEVPISLSSQDRRWFCVWTTEPRMRTNDGGFAKIARWLNDRDVSMFSPAAAPAWTEWKYNLVEHGMSSAESYLTDMIRRQEGEFAKGVLGAPFHAVCDRVALSAPPSVKVHINALLHAFNEAGWVNVGRIASREYPNKKQIFAEPKMLDKFSKSDLRRMVEQSPGGALANTLKLVK